MARVYKRSDIAEDDIFGDIAASAEKALKKVEAVDAQIIKFTDHYKGLLSTSNTGTVEGVNQLVAVSEDLNKQTKETVLLEKEKVKLQQLQTKLQTEEVKAMQQQTRMQQQKAKGLKAVSAEQAMLNEKTRQANELSRAVARFRSAEAGSLQQLEAKMKLVELALNRLTPEQIENTKQGQRYLASLTEIRAELMKQQAAYGKHTLNVGNYKSAYDGLGVSISQLAREMPAFANSIQTGFMAISNNLPMFFDELQKIKAANAALRAEGQPTVSAFKQIAGAIMSPMMALNAFVLLLTMAGPKLVEWIGGLFGAEKATKSLSAEQKALNRQREESAKFIGKESAEMVGHLMKLAATNKGSKERSRLISEINGKYGTHLKNLQDEAAFQNQVNREVDSYIAYQKERFRLKQFEEAIERNLAKQQKLRIELADAEKKLAEARAAMPAENAMEFMPLAPVNQGLEQLKKNLAEASGHVAGLRFELKWADDRLHYYGYSLGQTEGKIESYGYTTESATKKQKEANKEYKDAADYIDTLTESLRENQQLIEEMSMNEGEKQIADALRTQIDAIASEGQYNLDIVNKLVDAQIALRRAIVERQYQEELAAAKNQVDRENAQLRRQQRLLDIEEWAAEKKIEINDKVNDALDDRDKKHREKQAKEDEKALKDKEDAERRSKEFRDSMVEETLQEMKRISEEQEKMIDQQIANSQKMVDALQAQANAGNIQASQSIAAERKIIAEQMEAKRQAQREQQMLEEIKLLYTATENYVEKGDTVAVAAGKALLQVKGVKVLAKSLMGFFKGTKRTVGEELGAPVLPGRDGHIIRVDGAEKILNPEQSRLTGGATTDEIVNGYLMARSMAVQPKRRMAREAESTDAILIKKLDDLQQTIANKPELSMEFQQFSETLFEFAYKEKRGNNLVVNRYQYRKS
jgi:hypothetical protein